MRLERYDRFLFALVAVLYGGLAVCASEHGRVRRIVAAAWGEPLWTRAGLVVAGAGLAQGLVAWVGEPLHKLFHATLEDANADQDRWPQFIVGVGENIAYPWILYACHPEAAATLIVGWVGLKTLGSWSAWKSKPKDPHRGRRRLYAFMLLNGLQVALAALVYWLMPS